jgi:AcrR family transcriptional regulator
VFSNCGQQSNTPHGRPFGTEQIGSSCLKSGGHVAARAVDRRVQKTQQLLQSALMALIQEKGFEALSVQNILDRANVGRATFYAHYDNKEDLLVSRLDEFRGSLQRRQKQAHAQAVTAGDRLFAYSRELFLHVNEHRAVFRSMVGKRSGAVIQHLFHKMLVDLVREDLRDLIHESSNGAARREGVVHLIAGGLFGLVLWWVDGPMKLDVEQMDALFRRFALPAIKSIRS